MDESMINKIVPVELFGLEKKEFRSDRMYIGSAEGQATYSINVLYENTFDPSDGTHRFALLPDNPNFLKIKKILDDTGIELSDFPMDKLSKSLRDMYGAWVIVDMSKTPVCRVYTENVSKMVDGKPVLVHKAGEPIHKVDPKTKQDLPELAIMTQVPVWGFCRKSPNGQWVWMKDNDPMIRIQREINQGRMVYVDVEKNFAIADGPDTDPKPAGETAEESKPAEEPKREIAAESAANISAIG